MEPAEYSLMDVAEERMWWYRALHARAASALLRRPGPEGPVLDAGCGTGGLLKRLAARVRRPVCGVEYDWGAAARARTKSGAPVAAGTVNALPFGEAEFAAVVSLDVLCHRSVDPNLALAEFRRVLKPGGTLVLNMPAYGWLFSAHDVRVHNARRTTAWALRSQIAAAGFGEVEARYWNTLLFPLMVLQRKVIARRRDHASDVGDFPAWLDAVLHGVTSLELSLAQLGLRYPAGGSVLAVATRP
ncbi:MAG TPA: class I SAM-dependent methyltransferase [Acetobacteraceae bacterium]|nr:class I SAM-dependent methyltransferase [Acetobacteraceae bacterium]